MLLVPTALSWVLGMLCHCSPTKFGQWGHLGQQHSTEESASGYLSSRSWYIFKASCKGIPMGICCLSLGST